MRYAPLFLLALAGCAAPSAPPATPVAPDAAEPAVLASPAEQARMQKYIDDHIDRRYVRRTFSTASGDVDCVDFDQQPSCRGGKCASVPSAPSPPPPPPGAPPPPVAGAAPMEVACPAGTVPIVRLRLETMRRFRTLEDFFSKDGHGGKVAPPTH
jgi:hypothetical protein